MSRQQDVQLQNELRRVLGERVDEGEVGGVPLVVLPRHVQLEVLLVGPGEGGGGGAPVGGGPRMAASSLPGMPLLPPAQHQDLQLPWGGIMRPSTPHLTTGPRPTMCATSTRRRGHGLNP